PVVRPRRLVEAVASQSLREQGTGSRTARAWRWMLTGQGLSPISEAPGTGRPPDLDDIQAEARHVTDPDECAWPPWRYNFDPDPDRQQARRVLRWLTSAANAIPLLDPGRTLAAPEPPYAPAELIGLSGVGHGIADIEDEMMAYLAGVTMQGHEGQPAAEPSRYPPPQWGEGVEQAHDWVTGEDLKSPADHHGCGGYHPCPGLRRCSCEAAGYCLRG